MGGGGGEVHSSIDMYNNDDGQGGARGCEAHELK
jgi:hypothetical protein